MLAGSDSFSTIMTRIRPGTTVNTKQVNAKLQKVGTSTRPTLRDLLQRVSKVNSTQ